ncbi:hypothetical protein [Aquicoccus sp. SU-CL01552]|uniref:hypothetical protein n=1 Tax=Aquicoccus sp. SU-CL01552 TaxID=3127656 RepID=UPI0031040BE0
MIKLFKKFRESEAGAVTVDWVVLTAAVVALAGAAYTAISGGTNSLTEDTATFISASTPGTTGLAEGSK